MQGERRGRRLRRERGQATVEFALVLPLVLLVVVGAIQFGMAFNFWLDLNHVASQSARWVTVNRLPDPVNSSNVSTLQVDTYIESQILSKGLLDSVVAGVDEIQRVDVTATGGTFRLSFQAQQTGVIAYNATAPTVETALIALSTIPTGGVTVAGGPGSYTVTFAGSLAGQDVGAITDNDAGLTGPGANATVTNVREGADGVRACFTKGPGNTLATTPQVGDALSITISAPYKLGFGLADWFADPLTLRGRSTMRIEQVPSGSGWVPCA